MQKELLREEYRGCTIQYFEQRDACEFDGISYSYTIVDRQGNSRTDQTDEYPLANLAHANQKAIESIDDDLDVWWIISCLAANRNKYEHFSFSYLGEKDGAIEAGMKELANRYPGWKHSVSIEWLD